MSNLYDTDAVTWAEQQAALLRRVAGSLHVTWQGGEREFVLGLES